MVGAAKKLGRPATRADLEDLPENVKGEIIDGELYVQPRARPRHSLAAARLHGSLSRSSGQQGFDPSGWLILIEPGIELPDAPEVAPDLAGWRLDRVSDLDWDEPISVVPDWVCEVLSPSNRAYDRTKKFPFYARVGARWLWVIDPPGRTVEVKRMVDGRWVDLAAFGEDDVLRAEPFPELEIPLHSLWVP